MFPIRLPFLRALASNYGYVVFMAGITLFVVPIYVHLLGSRWGDVAICMTLCGFLMLADGALSPLLLRDAARSAVGTSWAVLRRFLRLYAVYAGCILALGLALLSLPAARQLDAVLLLALRLTLLQFVVQFVNGACIAFLMGRGHHGEANLRLVAFASCKHACALVLLSHVPNAVAYVAAFVAIGTIECAANLHRVWRERAAAIDGPGVAMDDGLSLAIFVGATALGLATGQVDRVFLMFALPSAQFGVYYLAGTVLYSLLGLHVPLMRALMPAVAVARQPRIVAMLALRLAGVTVVAPAIVLALFAQQALQLWLHDAALATAAAPALRVLMVALAANALYAPVGMLLVQARRYATIAAMNGLILVLQVGVLYALSPRLGMMAGAYAWLLCGAIQLVVAAAVWRRRIEISPVAPADTLDVTRSNGLQ